MNAWTKEATKEEERRSIWGTETEFKAMVEQVAREAGMSTRDMALARKRIERRKQIESDISLTPSYTPLQMNSNWDMDDPPKSSDDTKKSPSLGGGSFGGGGAGGSWDSSDSSDSSSDSGGDCGGD